MATRAGSARGGASVHAQGVTHGYVGPEGSNLVVLDDLDLSLGAGERVAISGRSGAGKSTLLALLGGLEQLQQGQLHVGGVDVGRLRGDDLSAYRRQTVGFVFQHFGLLDSLTAVENVELGDERCRGAAPGAARSCPQPAGARRCR